MATAKASAPTRAAARKKTTGKKKATQKKTTAMAMGRGGLETRKQEERGIRGERLESGGGPRAATQPAGPRMKKSTPRRKRKTPSPHLR